MLKYKSEQYYLKKIGIPDWRHMSKDKIIAFASSLPYMDPEVAKQALSQFPNFMDSSEKIISEYKEIIENTITENQIVTKDYLSICQQILNVLTDELNKEDLTTENKQFIIDKIIEVSHLAKDEITENRNFLLKLILGFGSVIVGVTVAAASILGSNARLTENDLDNTNPEEND